jgi:HSP20 family protein
MLPSLIHRRPRTEPSYLAFPRDLDQMFDDVFGWRPEATWPTFEETAIYPVDIREENGRVFVDAEMPGFDKSEVEVTVDQGMLNITAEHKEEKQEKEKGKMHLRERRYRRIERSFKLPVAVDESKVDANLKDGVLHLTLQKAKEAMAHKIAVK